MAGFSLPLSATAEVLSPIPTISAPDPVVIVVAPPESKYKKSLENAPPRPPPGVAFGFRLSHKQLDARAEQLYGKPASATQQVAHRIKLVCRLRYLCPKWPINDEFVWWKGDFYACICFVRLPPPDDIIDQTKDLLVTEGVIEEQRMPRWYKIAIT